MDISIIGSGQVGKRTGRYFSEEGHNVIFYDINNAAFRGLPSKYKKTLDIYRAIKESEVSIVTVPTPLNIQRDGYDNSYLIAAAKSCGEAMKHKDLRHAFILKSTVVPGTTRDVFIPTIELASGWQHPQSFDSWYVPEFLTVISDTWTKDGKFSVTPDTERVVIGAPNKIYNSNILSELYGDRSRKIVNYETAEVAKLLSNSRLPAAISFTNDVAELLDEINASHDVGIDVDAAIEIVHSDPRIGKYGYVRAAVDVPGVGKGAYGGPCFSKDPPALAGWLRKNSGKKSRMIESTIEVNERMKNKHGVRE